MTDSGVFSLILVRCSTHSLSFLFFFLQLRKESPLFFFLLSFVFFPYLRPSPLVMSTRVGSTSRLMVVKARGMQSWRSLMKFLRQLGCYFVHNLPSLR